MSRRRIRLATELKRAFDDGGWTLHEIAAAIGKSTPAVHAYLHGSVEPPGLVLLDLLRVLQVPVRPLLKLAA